MVLSVAVSLALHLSFFLSSFLPFSLHIACSFSLSHPPALLSYSFLSYSVFGSRVVHLSRALPLPFSLLLYSFHLSLFFLPHLSFSLFIYLSIFLSAVFYPAISLFRSVACSAPLSFPLLVFHSRGSPINTPTGSFFLIPDSTHPKTVLRPPPDRNQSDADRGGIQFDAYFPGPNQLVETLLPFSLGSRSAPPAHCSTDVSRREGGNY